MLRGNDNRYGLLAVTLHWVMALLVIGMFSLGLYMTSLSYYDRWYKTAFDMHKGVGILFLCLLLLRVVWACADHRPPMETGMKAWEKLAAKGVHLMLYSLMLLLPVTGYLISTAEGHPINVFGWFDVPSLLPKSGERADLAGEIHFYLGWLIIGLAALHALAALQHHFINHDGTLRKMLGLSGK